MMISSMTPMAQSQLRLYRWRWSTRYATQLQWVQVGWNHTPHPASSSRREQQQLPAASSYWILTGS